MTAAEEGLEDGVKYLLLLGESPDKKDSYGSTPLHDAVRVCTCLICKTYFQYDFESLKMALIMNRQGSWVCELISQYILFLNSISRQFDESTFMCDLYAVKPLSHPVVLKKKLLL